jgi:hypothetical protein
MTAYTSLARFKLVYQSGHTNTYCDGVWHIRTAGGTAPIDNDRRPQTIRRCDCVSWRLGRIYEPSPNN